MGHAGEAVEMLTEADEPRAVQIATYLEQQNRERQAMERAIVEQAIQQVEQLRMDGDDCRAIVLGGQGWHPGVIGIVASRLVDRFCKPTLVIAFNGPADGSSANGSPANGSPADSNSADGSAASDSLAGGKNGNGGVGQGSGRSIPGFHLARALEHCGEHLEAFGGHEMAAGLKVRPENFEAFRRCFCEYALKALAPEQLIPELKLDAEAELRQVTAALIGDLRRLGPFGHGNRRPLFCSKGLQIAAPPRRVGKTGNHLQLLVRQGQTNMKAIAFNFGTDELIDRLKPGTTIDLAFEPTLNEFNGYVNVELEVKDLQFAAG
jgi:single-stranded-DNA-specific exonuclease